MLLCCWCRWSQTCLPEAWKDTIQRNVRPHHDIRTVSLASPGRVAHKYTANASQWNWWRCSSLIQTKQDAGLKTWASCTQNTEVIFAAFLPTDSMRSKSERGQSQAGPSAYTYRLPESDENKKKVIWAVLTQSRVLIVHMELKCFASVQSNASVESDDGADVAALPQIYLNGRLTVRCITFFCSWKRKKKIKMS